MKLASAILARDIYSSNFNRPTEFVAVFSTCFKHFQRWLHICYFIILILFFLLILPNANLFVFRSKHIRSRMYSFSKLLLVHFVVTTTECRCFYVEAPYRLYFYSIIKPFQAVSPFIHSQRGFTYFVISVSF